MYYILYCKIHFNRFCSFLFLPFYGQIGFPAQIGQNCHSHSVLKLVKNDSVDFVVIIGTNRIYVM